MLNKYKRIFGRYIGDAPGLNWSIKFSVRAGFCGFIISDPYKRENFSK